jgi:hypothetical protein
VTDHDVNPEPRRSVRGTVAVNPDLSHSDLGRRSGLYDVFPSGEHRNARRIRSIVMRRTALSVVALLSFAGTAFAQQAYEGSWAGTKEDCSDPRMWVLSIESNEFWNFEAYCKIGRATKSGNQWKLSSKCSDNEGNWDDITIPLSILTNDRLIFNDSILVRCEHGPAKASTHRNAAAESSSGSAARPSAALMASDLLTRAVKCTRETRPSEVLKQLITMGRSSPDPSLPQATSTTSVPKFRLQSGP